ncbi:MAG: poly-gamma-glutamate system protein [Lachnospiraceae bacterium]|nr:poly-gamma-glutamate system protein [Lachnospiraceae bacterium]
MIGRKTAQGRKYRIAAMLVLIAAIALSVFSAHQEKSADYELRVQAATKMQACMDSIRSEKERRGLSIIPEDRFGTGMLGEEFTGITTTVGALEAKRTTANPDMAAFMIEMLTEAGIEAGDYVAAGFSGSFPCMNLALICACETMDVRLTYIASAGSSMYGANQPEMTFPDMVLHLLEEGLIRTAPAAFSMGGDFDVGEEMLPELRDEVYARLDASGFKVLRIRDFAENIAARRRIYETGRMPDLFAGIGGNISTLGLREDTLKAGVVPAGTVAASDEKSGLMEIYSAAGIPVLHVLNIKQLTADYGLAFDPPALTPIGEGSIYHRTAVPRMPGLIASAAAIALLFAGRIREKKRAAAAALSVLIPVLAAAFLLPACPVSAAAKEAEVYRLLEGTEEEIPVTCIRGREDGKKVYLVGGIHGDEIAGWIAAGYLRQESFDIGTVYIAAPINAYGAANCRRKTRSDRDINRNFPGDPGGTDAERIAAAVFADIADKEPDILIDLHEAHNRVVENMGTLSDDLHDALIFEDLTLFGDLALDVVLDVESGDEQAGLSAWNGISIYGAPPAGSINRTVTQSLGIPSVTVETDRTKPLSIRVRQHLQMVHYILRSLEKSGAGDQR